MGTCSDNLSIYLHWPFCRSKCPYCDFYSVVSKNVCQDDIIDGYLKQLEQYAQILPKRNVVSIFFGGGTPSLISPQNIERLLLHIAKLWTLSSDVEISLEANPNTQTPTLFKDLRHSGINRLSLGIQSLDDDELKFLGRTHNSKQALSAIDSVLKNFDNHSIDLIYALPNQMPEKWQNRLELATSFGLKHISLYQLTIEKNTVFERKGVKPLEEEKAAELYLMTNSVLPQKGYSHYEVSNYAKNGFESIHNKVYWQGGDYIGIGKTAHGRIKKDDKFFAVTDPVQLEELSAAERAEELVLMGLRLTKGIDKQTFQTICGLEINRFINQKFKQEHIADGLLVETDKSIQATSQGFLLLDYLIAGLCS